MLQSMTSFCSPAPDQSMKQMAIFWCAPDLIAARTWGLVMAAA